ncbi:MAG: ABC transporter substrate-binding protein [Burkholderiaceae bacterium]
MNNDFSSQIAAFKAAGCEIVTGNMIPPDFATFWGQAAQQNFKPRVVTIGKALLFPSVIGSLGLRGDGLTTEIWWTPSHPFKSSLTGESSKQLGDGYTKATGRPWTQPIGFIHALFEVAADIISAPRRSTTAQRCSTRFARPTSTPSSATSTGRARARSRTSSAHHWWLASGNSPAASPNWSSPTTRSTRPSRWAER